MVFFDYKCYELFKFHKFKTIDEHNDFCLKRNMTLIDFATDNKFFLVNLLQIMVQSYLYKSLKNYNSMDRKFLIFSSL